MKKLVNGVEIEMTPDEIEEMEQFWATPLSLDMYQSALQQFIDNKASERQYNNALSIASYADSTNEQWSAEAKAFIQWRDECYQYAINILSQVEEGTLPQPSIDDFINDLPQITWPEN